MIRRMTTPQSSELIPPKPMSSASLFLIGALIAIAGGILLTIGQVQATSYTGSYGQSDGTAMTAVGALVGLIGFGFVTGGIYGALHRIDVLHEAAVDKAARKAARDS